MSPPTIAKGPLSYDGVTADAVIRVYDKTRNVIEMHAHVGNFREF